MQLFSICSRFLFITVNFPLFKASTDWLVPIPVPRATQNWGNHAVGARAVHYGTKGEHYNASDYDLIAEYAFSEAKVSILQEKNGRLFSRSLDTMSYFL